MTSTRFRATLAVALLAGCRGDPASPTSAVLDVTPSVVSIVSVSGGADIDPAAGLTVTFNHAMMHVDSMRVVLHEGDMAGPTVPVIASWAPGRTTLSLAPAAPLKVQTKYTVELRCNAMGNHSSAEHDAHHGGTGSGGMMGGSARGGMHGGSGGMTGSGMHSGPHAMTFGFTTA